MGWLQHTNLMSPAFDFLPRLTSSVLQGKVRRCRDSRADDTDWAAHRQGRGRAAQSQRRSHNQSGENPSDPTVRAAAALQRAQSSFGSPSLGSPVRTPMMMQRWRRLGLPLPPRFHFWFEDYFWLCSSSSVYLFCGFCFLSLTICHVIIQVRISCIFSSKEKRKQRLESARLGI